MNPSGAATRRGLEATQTPGADANRFAQGFETSYRSAYVPEDGKPKRGDAYSRAALARSDMAAVMGQSKTTMADTVPTQRASYRNPTGVTGRETLHKIQQPKAIPPPSATGGVPLVATQTKCK